MIPQCPQCGKKLVHAIDISNREKKHIIYCTQPDCFDYQGEGDTEEEALKDLLMKTKTLRLHTGALTKQEAQARNCQG